MAEEERDQAQPEEPTEGEDAATEEGAPGEAAAEEAAPEEAVAEEAPAEEEAPDEGSGDDTPADEAAEEAPADEGDEPAADADEAAEAEGDAGGGDELTLKQRRRLERSRAGGPPRPQRSPEERAGERVERRRQAAAERRRHRARRRSKRGEPGTGTPPAERRSAGRKIRQGTVISSRAPKTISVRLEITRRHPTYEKIVRRTSTVHAHDERDEANEGDIVRVVETRPLSRTKRWRLLEIVERAR